MADGVKNVRRQRLGQGSWRQKGAGHPESRNSGMQLTTKSYADEWGSEGSSLRVM